MIAGMTTPKKPGRKANPDSKRQTGVSRHKNPRKAFHAPAPLFEALEAYCTESKPKYDESEVLRTALEQFLRSVNYWPRPPADPSK